MKNLKQDSHSLYQDLNLGPPEYEVVRYGLHGQNFTSMSLICLHHMMLRHWTTYLYIQKNVIFKGAVF